MTNLLHQEATDPVVAVYVDSCAWDFLFEHGVDLATELPPHSYSLYLTREVEIEISCIPDIGQTGNADKRALKAYIADAIATNRIQTSSVFGFASHDPDGSASKVQVYGGFNQGTWQSKEDRDWYAAPEILKRLSTLAKRPSGLARDQADASLAVRSFSAIVLTNERFGKTGPLRIAKEQGGKIIHLRDEFEPSGMSLGAFVAARVLGS